MITAASGEPTVITDGQFGESTAPVFLDNVGCVENENTLLDCPISDQLGLRDDNCGLDLGVRCPGMFIHVRAYMYIHIMNTHSCVQ